MPAGKPAIPGNRSTDGLAPPLDQAVSAGYSLGRLFTRMVPRAYQPRGGLSGAGAGGAPPASAVITSAAFSPTM